MGNENNFLMLVKVIAACLNLVCRSHLSQPDSQKGHSLLHRVHKAKYHFDTLVAFSLSLCHGWTDHVFSGSI